MKKCTCVCCGFSWIGNDDSKIKYCSVECDAKDNGKC